MDKMTVHKRLPNSTDSSMIPPQRFLTPLLWSACCSAWLEGSRLLVNQEKTETVNNDDSHDAATRGGLAGAGPREKISTLSSQMYLRYTYASARLGGGGTCSTFSHAVGASKNMPNQPNILKPFYRGIYCSAESTMPVRAKRAMPVQAVGEVVHPNEPEKQRFTHEAPTTVPDQDERERLN